MPYSETGDSLLDGASRATTPAFVRQAAWFSIGSGPAVELP